MANKVDDIFRPSADCPAAEDLVPLLEGRHGAAPQQRCHAHLALCPRCSAEMELVRRFESAQPFAGERDAVAAIEARLRRDSPAKPEPWWRVVWQPRILTPVSIALAAAAIMLVIHIQRAAVPNEPSIGTGDVMRSAQIRGIAPLGDIARAPLELRWQGVTGASRYEVRLLEVDRTELWGGSTNDTSVSVPLAVIAQLTPLKRVFWEVIAIDAAGNPLGSSGLQSFRVSGSN